MKIDNITTQGGLLYKHGQKLSITEADAVAREYGFLYAERLVKALETDGEKCSSPLRKSYDDWSKGAEILFAGKTVNQGYVTLTVKVSGDRRFVITVNKQVIGTLADIDDAIPFYEDTLIEMDKG